MSIPFQNLTPFMGVVQSMSDPSGLGRCKVRCFGIHPSADDPSVLVEHLPWFTKLDNSVGAIQSPDPKPGEWVFGFFLDGRDAQYPVIVGSLPGNSLGNLNNPWADSSSGTFNRAVRLASNPQHTGVDVEATGGIVSAATQFEDVQSAGEYQVSEPDIELTSGGAASLNSDDYGGSHVIAGEHVTMHHSSGTVVQINSEGSVVIHSTSDIWNRAVGNHTDVSGSNRDIIVENGQFNIRVNGNCNMHINGDMHQTVTGNYNLGVGGKLHIIAGEQVELQGAKVGVHALMDELNLSAAKNTNLATDTLNITSLNAVQLKTDAALSITAADGIDMTVSGGDYQVQASGNISENAGGAINMDASGLVDMQNGSSNASVPNAAPGETSLSDISSLVPQKSPTTVAKGSGQSGRSQPISSGAEGIATSRGDNEAEQKESE